MRTQAGMTIYLVMAPGSRHLDVRAPVPFMSVKDALARAKWLRAVGNKPVIKVMHMTYSGKLKPPPVAKRDGKLVRLREVVTLAPIAGLAALRCAPESFLHFYQGMTI